MKVYYVSNRYDGCWYVRCYLPMLANGWDGDKTSPYSPRADEHSRAAGAVNADVVVFQRPDQPNAVKIMKMLKAAGKKVVFDNDDTYLPDSGVPTQMSDLAGQISLNEMNECLNEAIQVADLVTTTTDFLAEEYKKLNPNVVVLPNAVNPEDWEEPIKNTTDKVRIGLVGSVSSNSNYDPIKPLLEHYKNDDRVQIVLLGVPRQTKTDPTIKKIYKKEVDFWSKQNIEWHHFVPQNDYNDKLNELALDIMLIPRHDSYFNRAKSNIKFLEASMCEVPVIAQGFEDGRSPYQGKEDAKHMVIVTDNDKWIEETEKLIENKELRQKIGKEAKEYVLKNYDIHTLGKMWHYVYEKLTATV